MSKQSLAIIIAGFLTVSIAYSIRYGYGMLLPEMLPALDMSKTQAGAVYAVYFIIYTLFTPVFGALSDHYSYRTILTLFAAILGFGAVLMSSATSFMQANLFFAIAAFGHAACWAPVVVLVQKWVPDSRKGMALSFVASGVGSGVFVWGLLLPLIVSASGWRSGWLALGLTALGVALLNLILVRNPAAPAPEKNPSTSRLAAFISSYRKILRQDSFWIIGVAYLLVGFNVIILFSFLPVYARESLGVPYAVSTRFVSVIALFGIGGQLVLGSLSDRIGRMKVMIFCSAVLAAACLGIALTQSVWSLYLLVGFYGIGYGAIWPVYAAVASDLFPRENTGGVVGLWTLFLGVGSMIAPVVCGWIIDTTGSYFWVYLSAMIAGLLSALFLLGMPLKSFIIARRKRRGSSV